MIYIVTLPVGAVAKYCNDHVCMCVSVCPRGYLQNDTCDYYQMFCTCCLWLWLGPPPKGVTKSHGEGSILGVLFTTDNAL